MSLHRLLGVGLLDKLEEEYLKGSLFVKLTKSLIGANKDQPIDVSAITAMHQLWYSSRVVCAVFGIGRTRVRPSTWARPGRALFPRGAMAIATARVLVCAAIGLTSIHQVMSEVRASAITQSWGGVQIVANSDPRQAINMRFEDDTIRWAGYAGIDYAFELPTFDDWFEYTILMSTVYRCTSAPGPAHSVALG